MKLDIYLSTFALLFFSACTNIKIEQAPLKLWYETPAEKWVEALPIGNGRIGAMVYGTVGQEHIQFNEETLWTGAPHNYSHKGASNYLGAIRQLLADGEQAKAEELAMKEFMSIPLRQKEYQPFGDLWLTFPNHEDYTDYHRELDLNYAQVHITYIANGIAYKRTYFVSQPDQLMVSRFEADSDHAISFTVSLGSKHKLSSVQVIDNQEILLLVKIEDGVLEGSSLVRIVQEGGTVLAEGDKLIVEKASSATVYLAAATTFISPTEVGGNPDEKNRKTLEKVQNKKYQNIVDDHVKEYQAYFNRFNIDLGQSQHDTIPTDLRIINSNENFDALLAVLFVQYARYLIISSSRPGTYPASLQGIWNEDLNPPWGSKYTTNINFPMTYWACEVLNLSECNEPLFKLIGEVVEPGRITAKEHYNSRGWVLHHNTDLWRGTAPINNSDHGIWVTGGAWLCHHLWEHFLFTRDTVFLKESYPIFRDAALFFTDFLVKDEKTGWLISSPSHSPEHGGLVAGPTGDHAIIRNLFHTTIEASTILGEDEAFADKLKTLLPQIAPYQIGRFGQLQEWLEDIDDPNDKHRYVSHLWAVYPGEEINQKDTPDLMNAAKTSLLFRGDEATAWSMAWKVNLWARFRDGNHAFELFRMLLRPAELPGQNSRSGSYPNLFSARPPFLIDGNTGGAAGIIEMLVQSHLNEIELLPALPDMLSCGKMYGVKARGGFELDFNWADAKLQHVKIKSLAGGKLKIRYKDHFKEMETSVGDIIELNGNGF
jgi:alpha-L-fucosidase 2